MSKDTAEDQGGALSIFNEGQSSYLIDSTGAVIPISQANPDATYIGLYTGFTVTEPRWGISRT